MQTKSPQQPAVLIREIASQSTRSTPADAAILTDELKSQFAGSLLAIILYGSCMRSRYITEGVVDLYVIVDSYNNAYQSSSLRRMNSWLPPNVFYLETGRGQHTIRAKYAVVSIRDLQRGTHEWFHSYLWSRFAQPVRLLYVRDDEIRDQVYHTLANAVTTFLRTTIPTLEAETIDAEAIWINGLALTYAAELRPEQRQERARHITHQNMGDYTRLTLAAAPALTDIIQELPQGYYQRLTGQRERKRARRQWRLRRWQGRVLSVLRLAKAAYTFRDCIDYAAWKIQRHTGVQVEITPRLRRHPVLFGFSVLWQLLRRGVIR